MTDSEPAAVRGIWNQSQQGISYFLGYLTSISDFLYPTCVVFALAFPVHPLRAAHVVH